MDAALVSAAALGQPVPVSEQPEIARGAAARFPVTAADLPERGVALGRRLKALERRWIAADFRPTREDLLADRG